MTHETAATDSPATDAAAATAVPATTEFIAINSITCTGAYRPRFEELFRTRVHAIDRAPGFRRMVVLRPKREGADYLVVSYWQDQASFDHWRTSPEFAAGHRRGFEDLKAARERGEPAPMASRMETYEVMCE
jgi:heme-degrading monooxygenase HmoA